MKGILSLFVMLFLASLCLFACGNPEEGSSSSERESASESESNSGNEVSTEYYDPDWTPPVK